MIDISKCKYKIIVDSREQKNNHILDRLEEGFEIKPSHHDTFRGKKSQWSDPIQYYIQERGLKTGDYSIAIQLPNEDILNMQDKVVVERKQNLGEICGNIFDSKSKDESGLNRFERELKRAKEQDIKFFLLIEESDMYSKILSGKFFRHDVASKVAPHVFIARLMALQMRYDINILYCDKKDSARLIRDTLYYWSREYLKDIDLVKA